MVGFPPIIYSPTYHVEPSELVKGWNILSHSGCHFSKLNERVVVTFEQQLIHCLRSMHVQRRQHQRQGGLQRSIPVSYFVFRWLKEKHERWMFTVSNVVFYQKGLLTIATVFSCVMRSVKEPLVSSGTKYHHRRLK